VRLSYSFPVHADNWVGNTMHAHNFLQQNTTLKVIVHENSTQVYNNKVCRSN